MLEINLLKYKDEIIENIKKLVSIKSVLSEPDKNAPFGLEISKALNETVSLCEKLGFKTYTDPEGYYGYADLGEGSVLVGVLGHLDVVLADNPENWKFPPFEATEEEGRLYGRGTQDDKGPVVAALYAAKALIDNGFKFSKRLRFIFGTDEENLWRCISKYMEKEEKPDYGFTPDSMFPLIFAEKGLLQIKLRCSGNSDFTFKSGSTFNAVPERAVVIIPEPSGIIQELNDRKYKYEIEDNKITVFGKSAHASKPEYGINAISRLASVLYKTGYKGNTIKFIHECIHDAYNGEKITGSWEDISGKLTINLGKIDINPEYEEIGLDIRIPVTYKKDDFAEIIREKAGEYGFDYIEYDFIKPIYISEDNFLIQTLMKVFEDCTGMDSKPIASGGATYARSMDNCVAFGAVFPGKPKTEHQTDEYILIDDIMKCSEIYANAIWELVK